MLEIEIYSLLCAISECQKAQGIRSMTDLECRDCSLWKKKSKISDECGKETEEFGSLSQHISSNTKKILMEMFSMES